MLDINLFELKGVWLLIGFIITFIIPLFLTLLIAKKRSIMASIFFLPFIIYFCAFLINNISFLKNFFTGGNTIANGVYLALAYIQVPIGAFHSLVVKTLTKIAPNNQFYVNNIINGAWFAFTFYGILFLLCFIIFHPKKKKTMRKYDDDF